MARIKISELPTITDSGINQTQVFLVASDFTGAVPVTRKISLSTIDTSVARSDANANSAGVYANGAFGAANSAGVYANGAFIQANAAFIIANIAPYAYAHANAGFVQANNALGFGVQGVNDAAAATIFANESYNHANAGFLRANTPSQIANVAYSTANGAFANANASFTQANGAFIRANAASITANNANVFTALDPGDWDVSPPTTINAAINRLANLVFSLNSNLPIP